MSDSHTVTPERSRFLPVLAGLFAIGIFFVDTFVPSDIAIAVLYVVVVPIASNIYQRRGIAAGGGDLHGTDAIELLYRACA